MLVGGFSGGKNFSAKGMYANNSPTSTYGLYNKPNDSFFLFYNKLKTSHCTEITLRFLTHNTLRCFHCSPTSDGGAAAILCSEQFVIENGLQNKAVEIVAMEMATDMPGVFSEKSLIKIVCIYFLFIFRITTYFNLI